jgi:hypothetical protein
MAYVNTLDKVLGITCATVTALVTEIALPVTDCKLTKSSGATVTNASGKRKTYSSKPGKAEITGSFEFILAPANACVLDLGLDETAHSFTYNEGAGLEKATACKVTSISIKGEFGNNVYVTVNFVAIAVSAGVAIIASAGLVTPYVCLNVTSEIGTAVNAESFEIGLSNNFESNHSMVGTSRLPVAIAPGYQGGVTLGMNFLENPTVDPLADELASEGAVASEILLTIGQSDGDTPSIDFEFIGLRPNDLNKGLKPESIIKYDANYIAEDMTYTLNAGA